jgi:hypothetical protein
MTELSDRVSIREPMTDHRPAILKLVASAFAGRGHDSQQEVDIIKGAWRADASQPRIELVATNGAAVGIESDFDRVLRSFNT